MDRDKNYLAWIRRLPCLICGNPLHTAPHHIPERHHASLALKTSDYRTIPLCTTHHCEYHDDGRDTFAGRHGIDYEHCMAELTRIYKEREQHA